MPENIYLSQTVTEENIRQQQSVAKLSTRPKPPEANMSQSKHLKKLCSALVQHYLNLKLMQGETP